ncbi:hypothetical protein V2J09_009654 [Rumex salicifolius]
MDLHSSSVSSAPTHHKSQPLVSYINKQKTYVLSFLLLIFTTTILFSFRPQNCFYPKSLNLGFSNESSSSSNTSCDYSNGKWVWDDNPHWQTYTEDCQFLDPGFRCHRNGRSDQSFRKWRWQPYGCDLPRFNASDFLERSRNGRIVFAGDSIGRNQWESLLCMLAEGVTNKSTMYEQNGNPITKHKGFLSILLHDYNLTVEYYRVPFLVAVTRPPPGSHKFVRGAINLDQLHWFSEMWAGAHVLVFNGGHWWNKDKTFNAGVYFEEGGTINMTMDYMEGFKRSLETVKSWVIQNLDAHKSHVFYRSFSPVHYMYKFITLLTMNGSWSQGGTCREKQAPETNQTALELYSLHNNFIYDAIEGMKAGNRSAWYLNITYMSALRTDGHPSIYREPGTPLPIIEDCSHWCLPGIPDVWNLILYAQLLADGFKTDSSYNVPEIKSGTRLTGRSMRIPIGTTDASKFITYYGSPKESHSSSCINS